MAVRETRRERKVLRKCREARDDPKVDRLAGKTMYKIRKQGNKSRKLREGSKEERVVHCRSIR
jgi:hypothetical protein